MATPLPLARAVEEFNEYVETHLLDRPACDEQLDRHALDERPIPCLEDKFVHIVRLW